MTTRFQGHRRAARAISCLIIRPAQQHGAPSRVSALFAHRKGPASADMRGLRTRPQPICGVPRSGKRLCSLQRAEARLRFSRAPAQTRCGVALGRAEALVSARVLPLDAARQKDPARSNRKPGISFHVEGAAQVARRVRGPGHDAACFVAANHPKLIQLSCAIARSWNCSMRAACVSPN